MQTMAMPRPPAMQSMPGQTMAGQMMPGQMMSPGINPNLGFGNLNGFGSPQTPFAGQFGSPLWNPTGPYGLGGYAGGIYGLGSLLGTYGNPVGAANPPVAPAGNAQDQAAARDKAALRKEKIESERLANQRKRFDEMQHERDQAIQKEQRRIRENPTLTEVVSGKALNDLLDDFRKLGVGIESANAPNALLPLDTTGLQRINVTRGTGNIALLKHGSQLSWPTALTSPEYRDARERLSAQTSEVVRQIRNGGEADTDALRQLSKDVDTLQTMLRRKAGELSLETFVEAKHFLQGLSDSLVALGQSDAAKHFTGQYALTAQSVLGLVKQMNDSGLRFAPAGPGDESAYVALREALAACHRGIQSQPVAR
jgi:hypothetical protein